MSMRAPIVHRMRAIAGGIDSCFRLFHDVQLQVHKLFERQQNYDETLTKALNRISFLEKKEAMMTSKSLPAMGAMTAMKAKKAMKATKAKTSKPLAAMGAMKATKANKTMKTTKAMKAMKAMRTSKL